MTASPMIDLNRSGFSHTSDLDKRPQETLTMSEILDMAHEMALDLVKVGAMDEITMRKMDALCLPPKPALKQDVRPGSPFA